MIKKEKILDIFLILLIILTIIQVEKLWINLNMKVPEVQEEFFKKNNYKNIIEYEKLIVNFGNNKHIQTYDKNIWKNYMNSVNYVFSKLNKNNIKSIDIKEYLKLQNNKSIIVNFNKNISIKLFLNLFKIKSDSKLNESIKEIYFSNNGIYIKTNTDIFKVNIDYDIDIDKIINSININDYNICNNLFELYSIPNNVYINTGEIILKNITYVNAIKEMDKKYKKNLIERFLNTNLDFIREIIQEDGNIYIYRNEILKLMNNGTIEYNNIENISSKTRNLYSSLKTAINFINSKLNINDNIYLTKINLIEENNNLGYKFNFNLIENNIPTIPDNSAFKSFIEIEVYSDFIKNFTEIYKRSKEKTINDNIIIKLKSLYDLISKNVEYFDEKNIEKILLNIKNIDIYYIDKDIYQKSDLIPSLCIEYKDKNLYFNLTNGKFIMEN